MTFRFYFDCIVSVDMSHQLVSSFERLIFNLNFTDTFLSLVLKKLSLNAYIKHFMANMFRCQAV